MTTAVTAHNIRWTKGHILMMRYYRHAKKTLSFFFAALPGEANPWKVFFASLMDSITQPWTGGKLPFCSPPCLSLFSQHLMKRRRWPREIALASDAAPNRRPNGSTHPGRGLECSSGLIDPGAVFWASANECAWPLGSVYFWGDLFASMFVFC